MVTLMLTLSVASALGSVPPDTLTLHAKIIRHVPVAQADLDLAREVTKSLLGSARIAIEWHDCDARTAACDRTSNPAPSIDVRLIAPTRKGHDDECGGVVPDPRSHLPVVLVYLPVIDEKLQRFRFGPIGRSDPSISTLQRGHLFGLIVAHEIGHALGLPHAARGVMKQDLDVEDVIMLRQSHLAFRVEERARLRDALAAVVRAHTSDTQRGNQ
jgi:hypothetical protein